MVGEIREEVQRLCLADWYRGRQGTRSSGRCCLELGEFCRISSLSHVEKHLQSVKICLSCLQAAEFTWYTETSGVSDSCAWSLHVLSQWQWACSSWWILSLPGIHSWVCTTLPLCTPPGHAICCRSSFNTSHQARFLQGHLDWFHSFHHN